VKNGQNFQKALIIFLMISAIFLIPSVSANITNAVSSNITNETNETGQICLLFFYGMGCSHCENVDKFLFENVSEKYSNVNTYRYEVYNNQHNSDVFQTYAYYYNFTFLGVPTIVIGDEYLIGDKDIIENLIPKIDALIASGGSKCKELPFIDPPPSENETSQFKTPPEEPWYVKSAAGLGGVVKLIIIALFIFGGLMVIKKTYLAVTKKNAPMPADEGKIKIFSIFQFLPLAVRRMGRAVA